MKKIKENVYQIEKINLESIQKDFVSESCDEKETLEDPVVNDSLIDSTKPKIKNTEPKLNKSDAETLFYNRQAFLRFNRFKIDRTLSTLSEISL